jgi:hypothetical protein
MMKSTRTNWALGALVVAVVLAAPAEAALIMDANGRPVVRGKTSRVIGEKDAGKCKVHPHKRTVKLDLAPDASVGDLLLRMSAITCRQFLLPSALNADSNVSVIAPELITPNEAYLLLLNALDSLGLTLEKFGKYERVVETTKAGTARVARAGYVTRFVRFDRDDTEVMALIFRRIKSEQGNIIVRDDAVIVTDLPDNIGQMLRLAGNR